MKHTQHLKVLAGALFVFAVSLSVQAGSLTNNFDYPQNYLLNGVVGDTNWDGVYLGFGDVPGGNAGGSGNGRTLLADGNISFGGYLTVQTTGSDWSAAGDDGFFLWKLVAGDFDVSVQSAPVWYNVANNFAGLLVRAFNTNNTGAPVSFTSPTPTENWLALFRCQQFGIGEIRVATNAVNFEPTFPDATADTNSTRFYRIVRTGDTFTFYWKTNQLDSWVLITNAALANGSGYVPATGSITRGDWHGQPVQVGIAQAIFSANSPQVYLTDFELTGPGVGFLAPPAAPSNIAVSSPSTAGSVDVSWTPGAGSAGSLVVLRGALGATPPPLIVSPINGVTYLSDTNYGDAKAWIAGGEQVVFAGSGNSVKLTGLGGSNNVYNLAVYSYSGAGPGTAYNTAVPAVTNFAGPGIVTNVVFSVNPTNIPVGGVGSATIVAKFSTGDSYDVSSDPSATLSSSDPTVVLIVNGVMNGLTNGTVTIMAGYAGVSGSASVSVHNPAFTDNFASAHDYVANGLMGSAWDGLFLNFGDVPNAKTGPDNAKGRTSVLNANVSSNAALYVEAAGSSWWVDGDDGPFLFKIVTGDFQASVRVSAMSIINNCDVGVMARLFDNSGGSTQGGGGGAGGTETHIKWAKIQNGTPAVRRTIDSGGTTVVGGLSPGDGWLLMQRVNSTNFLVFEKANPGDPWTPVPAATLTLPEAASNALMEVGIEQEMRTASDGWAALDTLMIDGPGILSPTGVQPPVAATNLTVTLNGDLSMTFNWVAADALGNPVASILVMRAGGPVTAQPTYGIGIGANSVFGAGQNLGGGNYAVYKSANTPTSTNNTVTVTGLTPGVVYYAAVYTYIGPFGTRVFNNVLPASGASLNKQDGSLISIHTLPPPTIPMGGLGQLQVIGDFTGGATVNVSPFAVLVAGDTNIIVTADGALTGVTNGTTTVTVVYGGFTNVVNVTVRPPGFTDNFTVGHDYLANGVAGTPYDGVYLKNGDIPESTFAAGTGQTLGADANIGAPGVLSVTNMNGQWENDGNDGFFLFKYVPADFQMAVHIIDYDIVAYTFPGLGARAYSFGANKTNMGAPLELAYTTNATPPPEFLNGEDWVSFTRFDEFGIGTYARLNITNTVLQSIQLNINNGDNWILVIRQNGTNFNFYERSNNISPWRLTPLKTSYQVPEFAELPMQVGIEYAQYTATPAYGHFDSYMLDAAPATLQISESGGNVLVSWPAVPSSLEYSLSLHPPNWQAVQGTPAVTGLATYTATITATNRTMFFRLVH